MNKNIAITALAASVVVLIFTIIYIGLALGKAHGSIANQSQEIFQLRLENDKLTEEVSRQDELLRLPPEKIYVTQVLPVYIEKPVYIDKIKYIYVPMHNYEVRDWRWR